MKENKILWFVDALFIALLLILLAIIAVANMVRGNVPHPRMFLLALAGFVLFIVAKASVLRRGRVFSIGTRHMSTAMGNLYRVGCWLMFVGCLFTFV